MREFRVTETGYKKFKTRWLRITLPITAVGVIALVFIFTRNNQVTDVNTTPWIAGIMVLVFSFSIFRSLKRQKEALRSYSVTITDTEITRQQAKLKPLTINFMEIREITKSKKGHITIKGEGTGNCIYIPSMIEDAAELEQRLTSLATVLVQEKESLPVQFRVVISILAILMMVAVYAMNNKIIVGISGAGLTVLFSWYFYQIQISRNVNAKAKRTSFFMLIALASIIYITYLKLTAP